jgi:hypothetical protein
VSQGVDVDDLVSSLAGSLALLRTEAAEAGELGWYEVMKYVLYCFEPLY